VLGTRVGLLLAERWRAHGVDVRLGARVEGIRPDEVLLGDGVRVGADVVLVAVGVEPARELLPAQPLARVLVAGDAAGSGHWTAASLDGVAAARRILGLRLPGPQPPYVWSDQFGLRLQIVGTPGPEDETELEGGDDSFAVRYRRPDGRMSAVLLVNRPAEVAPARRALLEDALALAA
jgi:NADPH-dependent 2,4-dienoyl-CoA reductase/sulfur reductase-like enzyme